jgi:hypothetical protein
MAPLRASLQNRIWALALLAGGLAASPASAAAGLEIFPQPIPLLGLIVLFTILILPANALLWQPLLRVLDQRRERLAEHLASSDFAPYDVAVSSATWAPAEWLELAAPLLAPGGAAFAFATRDVEVAGARRIEYRVGDRERTLLIAQH